MAVLLSKDPCFPLGTNAPRSWDVLRAENGQGNVFYRSSLAQSELYRHPNL
jgi:hypothetical protein